MKYTKYRIELNTEYNVLMDNHHGNQWMVQHMIQLMHCNSEMNQIKLNVIKSQLRALLTVTKTPESSSSVHQFMFI